MKKFVYSLEKILNIKTKLEDLAKTEYQHARAVLDDEEKKLLELRLYKEQYENKIRTIMEGRLDFPEIKKTKRSIDVIKALIFEQRNRVIVAKKKLEMADIKLKEAMIEKKTQEKLKEKAFENYLLEYKEWEFKEIDELNSFNYGNQKRN